MLVSNHASAGPLLPLPAGIFSTGASFDMASGSRAGQHCCRAPAEAQQTFWTERSGSTNAPNAMGSLAAWCDDASVVHWTQAASGTPSLRRGMAAHAGRGPPFTGRPSDPGAHELSDRGAAAQPPRRRITAEPKESYLPGEDLLVGIEPERPHGGADDK